jgi:hypothetical protein
MWASKLQASPRQLQIAIEKVNVFVQEANLSDCWFEFVRVSRRAIVSDTLSVRRPPRSNIWNSKTKPIYTGMTKTLLLYDRST